MKEIDEEDREKEEEEKEKGEEDKEEGEDEEKGDEEEEVKEEDDDKESEEIKEKTSESLVPGSKVKDIRFSEIVMKAAEKLREIPTTSSQFETDLRSLKSEPDHLRAYLRSIPPQNLSSIFKSQLESSILI